MSKRFKFTMTFEAHLVRDIEKTMQEANLPGEMHQLFTFWILANMDSFFTQHRTKVSKETEQYLKSVGFTKELIL